MQLNYDIVTKDEIIVRIQGDLDINTCDEFRDDLLEEYKKNPKDIRIDATDLSFCLLYTSDAADDCCRV